MDSEWVGRAGILAEAVSFILIAPEIIGVERMRGLEERLERLPLSQNRVSFRYSPPLLLVFVGGPVFLIMGLIREHQQMSSLSQLLYLIPAWFSVLLLALFAVLLLWVLAVGAVANLSDFLQKGDDRLRALVFGTGLVLLFGGLGAQFYGSF